VEGNNRRLRFASLASTHAVAANEKEAIKKCDIDAFREFKHGDKETKLQAIIDFGKCIKNQNKSIVGSYLRHVENRVGVIVKGDNVTSVNFTPPNSEQTFHLDIAEVSDEKKRSAVEGKGVRRIVGWMKNQS
jgi:hypothetical protein